MNETLAIRIPVEYRPVVTHDWREVTVSIPLVGDEDFHELGSSFVALGLGLMKRAAVGETE